jgi:hypothetical protein
LFKRDLLLNIFILLAVFTLTAGQFLPFEFSSPGKAQAYYTAILLFLPIAVCAKILLVAKRRNKDGNLFFQVIGALSVGFICFFVAGF